MASHVICTFFVSDVVLVETHCNLDHLCLFLLLLHPSPPDRVVTYQEYRDVM